MGGSSPSQFQTQATIQHRDPWGPAVPALNTAIGGAMDAYNNTYQGPQVASMDPNVTAGQNAILQNAAAGGITNAANGAIGSYGGIMNNGGLSDYQKQGAAGAQGGLNYVNQAAGNLSPIANGSYLDPKNNPYFSAAMNDALNQAKGNINSQFSSGGRYGSGAMADSLGRALGNVATSAYANQYNQGMNNMLAANGQLGSLGSQAAGIGGQLAGIGQQGVGNLANAGQGLSNLATAQNTNAANQAGVGAQRMDYQQQLIDAANQAPWARVGNLSQIASGIGSLGGTTSGVTNSFTQQQGGGNALSSILGGGLSGLGALGNIAKAGGFAALFSDERLKENIERVGKTDDGQSLYMYNYKNDPLKRKTVGLLAQEVARKKPEAVHLDPSGYLKVDYGKALSDA